MSMNKDEHQTSPGQQHEKKPTTREENRKALKNKEVRKEETTPENIGWHGMPMSRKRAFPIWLRLITLFVACALALVIGAMVGYGVIGHGNPFDVFRIDTWVHILKFLTKGT